MRNPQVTVLISVYNGALYVRKAIDSILDQTYSDFELLIINDGSTDETPQILNGVSHHPQIRIIHNQVNQGLIATRNLGLQEAKGKYLAILDADDIALPNRLALQYQFFSDHPHTVLCGGHAYLINKTGEKLPQSIKANINSRLPIYLLFRNQFVNSSTMFEIAKVKELGGFGNQFVAEDYELWIKIAEKYPIANLDEFLVEYRIHDTNVTSVYSKEMRKAELNLLEKMQHSLGISPAMSLEVHHSILQYNYLFSYEDYQKLLGTFKRANLKTRKFLEEDFNQVIFEIWSEIVLYKGGAKAVLHLFNPELLTSYKFLTLKKVKRALKLSKRGLITAMASKLKNLL